MLLCTVIVTPAAVVSFANLKKLYYFFLQQQPTYTQGPIYDQTPVQKEAAIGISTQANVSIALMSKSISTNQFSIPIADFVTCHAYIVTTLILTQDDDAAQSNQPSQDVMIPNLVGGQKPACFDFDIGKCRELRSIIMSPNCTFDE